MSEWHLSELFTRHDCQKKNNGYKVFRKPALPGKYHVSCEEKMKVIMLSGPSRRGKTTTLNLVYCQLVANGATILKPKTKLGEEPNDFECVLNYKGKKVAIFTMGDYSRVVVAAMEKYNDLPVDVLIIACNDKFVRPYQAIKNYSHTIVHKVKNKKTISDEQICDTIISLI